MAGNRKFHNKFHSANHHTLPSPHITDSGLDPIASHEFPFMGDYVICGLVSASNNYLLNGPRVKSNNLDTVPFGLPAPAGWNVFRDSMYVDGDITITGNLTALGELTYLHTQVHATSATEIEVWANNSNGKNIGLLVDQHGTNDIVHFKNDGNSSLLMTGSGDNPGWIGINLSALESQNITLPNQRMTIVGSVSVVPDSGELANQLGQQDPGMSGSLYLEGGLHVNDKTFLDQTTIDTTDGKFYVSGNNNDKDANIFDVDVPTELDKLTVDTTDDKFYIHGTGVPGYENPLDVDVPTQLDRLTVDTTDGKFYVHGNDNDKHANIFDVDVPTELDKLTVDTTDDDMLVTGGNTLDVDVPADFEKLVDIDELHVDTTDGDMVVSGSNTLDVDVPADFESPVDIDELHVDTTDGDMVVSGSNTLDVDVPTDFEKLVDIDELHVDTTDGDMVVSGSNTLDVDVPTDFESHVNLDQVTIDTSDGDFNVLTTGTHNKFKVDVDTELDKVTVDTNDGPFSVISSGQQNNFVVDVATQLDQLTVDTNDGEFLITTSGVHNFLNVNVESDFNEQIRAKDLHVTSPSTSGVVFDGNGSFVAENALVDMHPLKVVIKSITDIDTGVGQLTIKNTEAGNWANRNKAIFQVPTVFDSLSADTQNMDVRLHGTKNFVVDIQSYFNNVVNFNSTVNANGLLNVNNLTVTGETNLNKTTISTDDGSLQVIGSEPAIFDTKIVANKNVHIKGDLTVDGNAYLSAGEDGLIYVGDKDTDNVIFRADVSSNILPDADGTYDLGSEAKRWSNIQSVSSTTDHLKSKHSIVADGTLDVDGKTTLDETNIDTTDGPFVVNGANRSHVFTDLSTYGQVSALGGPWIFGACDDYLGIHGTIDFDTVENAYEYYVPPHPFQVDCRSLFQQGLTARGPVQIGELPDGVTDELPEPTLEILGNVHLREGNLKIVSDIRHLEDEHTLIRFKPDRLEFRVGDAGLMSLTETPASLGEDIVEIGSTNEIVDLRVSGESEFVKSVGIGGANQAKEVIGSGLDVHGSARVTETLSAGNLIVDYLTVQKDSFGNVGSGGHGGGAAVSTLSGIALSGAVTNRYLNGETISFEGTEVGVEYDILNDSQGDIQKLYSFTIVALSGDDEKGIHVGDSQSTTYQFTPMWDEYYSQAHVHDVEYGIIHTSDNPIATITSVVLSATEVPTSERIVKVVIRPVVDCEFYVHNVLEQTAPKVLDTITTGDFKINGELTVAESLSASQDATITGDMKMLSGATVSGPAVFNSTVDINDAVNIDANTTIKHITVNENLHVKGDLRVDGNAYLSAGSGGVINVGDAEQDVVVFQADVGSSITPDKNMVYDIGSQNHHWNKIYTHDIWVHGGAEIIDNLSVGGKADITQTLNVSGKTIIDNDLDTTGNVAVSGDLQVEARSTLNVLNVSGSGKFAEDITIHGPTNINNTVDITESATISGSVGIGGNTTINGNGHIKGIVTISDDTLLEKNLHVKGDLRVDGNAYLSAGTDGVINVGDSDSDNVVFHGDIDSDLLPNIDSVYDLGSVDDDKRWKTLHTRNVSAVGTIDLSGTQTIHGDGDALVVHGNTNLNGELNVTETAHMFDDIRVDGDTYLSGAANVEQDINGKSNLTIDGNTYLSGTADTVGVIHGQSDLHVDGDTYLSGGATIAGYTKVDNDLLITGTTKLSGHVEIDDHVDIHGDVNMHDLTASGHAHIQDDLAVDNNTSIGGNTDIGGNTGITGTLIVSGGTTLQDTLDVTNEATFDSNVYIKGDLRVDGNAYLSGGESGYIHVGDSEDDIVSFQADVGSDIAPDSSNLFNLGSADKTWNEIHWNGGNTILSNSVYNFVNTTSGDNGFANLSAYKDDRYVLRHDQLPDLAITHVHRVSNKSLVGTLKSQIHRGDVVLVEDTHDNLIAIADHPTGDYDPLAAEYVGYEKLFAPGDMVRFINGKSGPSVTFTTDDFDDTLTVNKFVNDQEKNIWNSTNTTVDELSSNWSHAYSTVYHNSGDWTSTYSTMSTTSADWSDTRTTLNVTSGDWDDTRTTLSTTSADWNDTRNTLYAVSGDWNSVYSSVNEVSGDWNSVYNNVNEVSGDWNSVYNNVNELSGDWNSVYSSVNEVSGDWNSVYSSVNDTSGSWDSVYSNVNELSGDWSSVYSSVNETSGDWNSVYTSVNETSADWDSVYTSVNETSGDWDSVYSSVNETSGDWDSVYSSVNETSGDWDSVYSSVNEVSGDWNSVYSSVNETSGDWNSVYSSVNDTSGSWDSVYSSVNETSGDWNSVYSSVNEVSGDWNSVYSSVNDTSGSWDSVYSSVNDTSGSWDSVYSSVNDTSGTWDSVYTSVNDVSGDWNSVYSSVNDTSGSWDSVYSFINGTSGDEGYATLINGKLDESQVPNLSITETYVVTNNSQVSALCDGSMLGPKNIEAGDLVIVTDMGHNLIAMVNEPTGLYDEYFDTFNGFTKLVTPTDYIQTVNSKHGHHVVINPDDLDDTNTAHKFVTQLQKQRWDSTYTTVYDASANWNNTHTVVSETSADWNSVYSWVNSDSATNNAEYNQSTYINASGDTVEGDLTVVDNTTLNTLVVSGEIDAKESATFFKDIHVKGDLRVDGNAYLSAGPSGTITVGDDDTDNVIFKADINSTIVPDINDTYSLGTSAKKWSIVHSQSASFGEIDTDVINVHENLNVFGTTTLSGKSDTGPGIIITGTPTGITDVNTTGFEDRDGDYMLPDVDITGDVALHGSLSADNAHIYSLTASNFKAEYQQLVINDGDLELLDGTIRQRGGNVLIEGDLAHIDDENTYIRFEPDSIELRCHDQRMIQLNEYPFTRDIIKLGDEAYNIDLKIQNFSDPNTFFVDANLAYIGIGTDTPAEKLHVATGQAQFAHGDKGGAVMITSGTTDERVDKTGSIRWNSEVNRYEGYRDDTKSWVSLQSIGDTDGDTYIDVDAGEYADSDRMTMYTVGCSAMTIYPNQTVAFAGDIQFDNITVYDSNSVTGPLTATSEFIYLKVNGKDRAIRLWTTPEDTREDMETFHGESVTHIGDDCGLGLSGQIPTQTISAQNVLFSPPTQ